MKLDTGVFLTKGFCHVAVGATTPLAASLAQWANSGEWPHGVIWIVIAGACIGGAANSLLSFLSTAYSDLQNGNGHPPPEPPKP